MGILQTIKSLFAPAGQNPPDPPRLDAESEAALVAALKALPAGMRGWITIAEARSLFSAVDEQYAFGEMDERGQARLDAFARDLGVRCDFRPVEARLYFAKPFRP
jgi:hypothetical protein